MPTMTEGHVVIKSKSAHPKTQHPEEGVVIFESDVPCVIEFSNEGFFNKRFLELGAVPNECVLAARVTAGSTEYTVYDWDDGQQRIAQGLKADSMKNATGNIVRP